MKWRKIIWRKMKLQAPSTGVYLALFILFVTSTESDNVSRSSVRNLQSLTRDRNGVSVSPNDSKNLNIAPEMSLSSIENNRNSPALNSFLHNVLRAQYELKWIDDAVRRVETKEMHEKVPARYMRASRYTPGSRYRSKIRFKRRSNSNSDDQDSWRSSKSAEKYNYDDNNFQRVYLDDEMKVKRYANPTSEFDDQGYRSNEREYFGKSDSDDREPVYDSTLKRWANEQGLQSRGPNRMDDFSRKLDEDWVENSRKERDAHGPSAGAGADEPSLESLKKMVLELRKSLEDSDKKMDVLNEMNEKDLGVYGGVKNRERNVEDISREKESRGIKDEGKTNTHSFTIDDKNSMSKNFAGNLHYDPAPSWDEENDREVDEEEPFSSRMGISGINWWEDPRSAVDMFDFKKRDDDSDDEDDDEDSAAVNSEFDYMTRRVKREKDVDGGEKKVRVYRRAGFGELYPEKKTCEKENVDEKLRGSKNTGRVYREIRKEEEGDNVDKINADGVKSGDRKSTDINLNENGHSGPSDSSGSDEISKIKISRDDYNNPVEKSVVFKNVETGGLEGGENVVAGTVGDSNLAEKKKPGLLLSTDEKRSPSRRDREEKVEQDQVHRGIDSASEDIKSGLDELLKTLPMEPIAEENISMEKNRGVREKKEVDKSEPNDDDDVHKLMRESNNDKKHQDEKEKETFPVLNDEKTIVSLGDTKKNDEKEPEIKDDDEDLDKRKPVELSNDKTNSDHESESRIPEIGQGRDYRESKTVKDDQPENLNTDIKENEQKDSKSDEVKGTSEISGARNGEKEEIEKDVASGSKGGSEKSLKAKNDNKEEANHEDERQKDFRAYERDEKMDKVEQQDLDHEEKESISRNGDSTRKLLWLSEKSTVNEEKKVSEIRDGRRDSAWDQNHGEKSGQRPANFLRNTQLRQDRKNNKNELKFVKRSLMVTDFGFGEKPIQLEKRSLKSYPENVDDDSKRKKEEKESDNLAEDAYEIDDDSVGVQEEEDFKDSGANKKAHEREEVESEDQSQSSSVRLSSNQNGDRDPMRDRINMLIKQKLDDREKGRSAQMKREAVNYQAANIEYYDYDGDVNGGNSDTDSTVVESEMQRVEEQHNTSYPLVAIDLAPESMTKKDEAAEEEQRQETEKEQNKNQPPKEEFISDVELAKTQTKIPPASKIDEDGAIDTSQESGAKTDSQWLGQPADADSDQEQDTIDRPDRYEGTRKPGDREKSFENENGEALGEPLEYSVNVRGKLDPQSIDDAMVNENGNIKDDDDQHDGQLQIGDDEDDSKYEEIRSQSNDESQRDQQYSEKSSGSNRRYEDSARIEERSNDQELLQNSFPRDVGDGRLSAVNEDVPSSREVRLVHESLDQDSLPTMLDRSGSRILPPGERTYLVIAPQKVQHLSPRKENYENSSSSSSSSSSSGSNYLALKITDDMFKGGIEQGNPIEDDNTEDNNFEGKTTTEWKVIKMEDDSRMKSDLKSNGLLPDNKIVKIDSNNDKSSIFGNPSINPQDVVHESIVDAEEMAGDFDDDARPRIGRDLKCVWKSHSHFGRTLQSVSHSTSPFDQAHIESGEEPVDKYLKNTQIAFKNSETIADRQVKDRSPLVDHKETEGLSKSTDELLHNENEGKLDEEKIPITINAEEKNENSTAITKVENLEKRSWTHDCGNETTIDKDKRGSTNVEEWEMNTPTVQKQQLISRSQNGDRFLGNFEEKGTSGIKTADLSYEDKVTELKSGAKTSVPDLHDTVASAESHEREIRSAKINDEYFRSDLLQPSHDLSNKKRSKIHKGIRSNDKFRRSNSAVSKLKSTPKYAASLDSNRRYNYDEEIEKKVGNSDLGYKTDRRRFNPGENIEEKHHRSKTDEHWGPILDLHKDGKGDRSNHGQNRQHASLEKHRDNNMNNDKASRSKDFESHGGRESLQGSMDNKTPLKSIKGSHGERNFKEVRGNPVMHRGKANNKITAGGIGHSHTQLQSKAFENREDGGYDESGNDTEEEKKVLDENGQNSPSEKPQPDEAQKKKFTVLLAADNMEDESQMDLALHGELAGKIVERIFDQVQKNDALKSALGPGLYRKHKSEDAVASDKTYREGLDENEVKHTEGMMRRVMELLGRLILDEVQRKTCASLPPDMREFLQWMLGVEDDDRATDQSRQQPPLPLVHDKEANHHQDDKFLFEDSATQNENGEIDEVNKKVRLLKGLINEYNSLTDREKTKVQSVHDYLAKQLNLLLSYIEGKETGDGGGPQAGAIGDGNILQYQNAVPNPNGTAVSESTLSPLVHTPSILMLSNASFIEHPSSSNHLLHSRFRETRSSGGEKVAEKRHSKGRKHRKHKRPHSRGRKRRKNKGKKHKEKKKKKNKKKNKKHQHKKHRDAQSPEYKKLIRRAAMLRKKRANIYEDDWDPIDSGYEEPIIYTSSGELTNKRKRSSFKKRPEDDGKLNNPELWADALSGKLEGDEQFDEKSISPVRRKRKKSISDNIRISRETDLSKNVNFGTEKEKRNVIAAAKNRDEKSSGSDKEVRRDVLSTSIALQPWINPKPDDNFISSDYLKELTKELVHGSQVPPVYPGDRINEEDKKRGVGMTEGRHLADDEVMLLSKREAWRAENEQQLEEVAFGKDMRGKWKEKEQFEKLTEMDRKRSAEDISDRKKREGGGENSVLQKSETDGVFGSVKSIRDEASDDEKDPGKNNHGYYNSNSTAVKKGSNENALSNATRNYENPEDSTNMNFGAENSVPKKKGDKKIVGGWRELDKILASDEKEEKEEEKTLNNLKMVDRTEGENRSLRKDEFSELVTGSVNNERSCKSDENSLVKSDKNVGKRENKESSSPSVKPEIEGSEMQPFLKISEQREQQKEAAKAEKDDQLDIADQMLGFQSPHVAGLNTY